MAVNTNNLSAVLNQVQALTAALGNNAGAAPANGGTTPAAPTTPAANNTTTTPAANNGQGLQAVFNYGSIGGAVASMAQIVGVRSQLLAVRSYELTADASKNNGQVNTAALAALNLEMAGTALLSEEAKKLKDEKERAERVWTS